MLDRNFILQLPKELSPGTYTLVGGFYDPAIDQRQTAADGSDKVTTRDIQLTATP